MNSSYLPPLPPAPTAGTATTSPSNPSPPPSRVTVPGGRWLAIFFGIVLPVIALAVELTTGMAGGFLDPVPTLAHALLIALVPLAHLVGLRALGSAPRRPSLRFAIRLNSAAFAISLVYAAYFIPITPAALMGIIFFGLGLLALSPLTSLIAALCLGRALRRQSAASGERPPSFWPGFLAALLCLTTLEAPAGLVTYGVRRLSDSPSARSEANILGLLRTLAPLGGEEHLLRGAYSRFSSSLRQEAIDFLAGGRPTEGDYQLAYYRVTGRAYNSVPAPRPAGLGGMRQRDENLDWTWDDGVGAQQVGRRLRSLALVSSRLDGHVEAEAAQGYVEWTLEFRNDHGFEQREARAVLQLPPGAAVSRLTLWVNGEEREAAWGGRAQVVEAYRSVAVVQRRDPVLVTSCGPDRVLVQCFPIEPRGGLMKIRLGVTTPLALAAGRAHLLPPRFVEQNFTTPPTLAHQVWIEATAPLQPGVPSLVTTTAPEARDALRGEIAATEFARASVIASVAMPAGPAPAWTPALRDPSRVVTQTLRTEAPPSGPVALVISGSADLAAAANALADLLAGATASPFATIYVGGDQLAASPARLDAPGQARWLRARAFAGGQDDGPALSEALDALAARGGGTLVWLHGGQPVAWRDTTALEQRLARRAGLVNVLAVPALAAPNVLLEKIAATATPLATFARLGSLPADLARLRGELQDGRLVPARESHLAEGFSPVGARVSEHLSRLRTRDEVYRLLGTGSRSDHEAAGRLALAAQLVTPVSGAVVLETKAQYDAAGLRPSDAQNSPVVPEPATCALLMAAAALAHVALRRPRRLAMRPPATMRASAAG